MKIIKNPKIYYVMAVSFNCCTFICFYYEYVAQEFFTAIKPTW
jgi:hypothetical protein